MQIHMKMSILMERFLTKRNKIICPAKVFGRWISPAENLFLYTAKDMEPKSAYFFIMNIIGKK